MHILHPPSISSDQYELSRHASMRHAVLTAVQQRQPLKRSSSRAKRSSNKTVMTAFDPLAVAPFDLPHKAKN